MVSFYLDAILLNNISMNNISMERPYLTSACITFLLLVCVFIKRSNGFNVFTSKKQRAPQVPYWLPWVGSAVEMGKDPDAFFGRARYDSPPLTDDWIF